MKLVKKINILGTQYSVYRVKANENEYMTKMNYGGMCTTDDHRIYILDLSTVPDWADESEEVRKSQENCTVRHEVIHAFFNESGLQWNSFAPEKAWAKKTRKWWTGLPFSFRRFMLCISSSESCEVRSWIM